MATKITVNYKNVEYTLEYTRATARAVEQMGFVNEEIANKPVTMIPLLVYGAFMRHHRDLKQKEIDEIYGNIVDKVGKEGEEGFINVLREMYAETASTLMDDKPVDEGNAATWKVTKG